MMPEITRLPLRMNADVGLDLVHPGDRMPPGSFQKFTNVRVVQEGALDGRPGYTPYGNGVGSPKLLHSIRRLNDPDAAYAPTGYTYVVGNGTTLEAGIETALTQIDTGYSGKPLSLLPFRPEVSPESWMYVYDANKQVKVRPDGTVRAIGVVPPNAAPAIEYGIPAAASVVRGQSAAGWGFSGASTAISAQDRLNATAFTISAILYNSGTTGWACITPSAGNLDWSGQRMNVILAAGAGNEETVTVREVHAAITTTTIAGIKYDSGSTGLCSIVLTNAPTGMARNSLIRIAAAETVRVLAVTLSPDGTAYSVRCSTAGTRAAGDSVTGLISWYTYTAQAHVATEAITSNYLLASQPAAGTGTVAVKTTENSSNAGGRPIDPANDYLHISIFLQNPLNVVELDLLVDVDPATAAGTAFTGNFWQWTLTLAQIGTFGAASGNVWLELVLPISQGVRHGGDLSLNFSTVQAVGVSLTTTGACAYGFDWWYFFGTYGPVIHPNSPVGYQYVSRDRDSTTGAASVPGPITRYMVFPLREDVIVTPAASSQSGVDYLDIYRQGGVLTEFLYIGSVQNGNSFTDGLSDATILASNPPAVDTTLVQPWPVLDTPWSGTVNVVGTSVTWVSGTPFNAALIANSVILINGVAFLTYGQPKSTTFLELQSDAGVLTGATYSVQSPTLVGQPLPVAFGPLEGPFLPVAFALGDNVNAGTLYFTNPANLDAASDKNTLELTGPTEPLVTGEVWNGLSFAGSRENVYLVRYSYQAAGGSTPYQYARLPASSGFWSRWAICRGPDGIYALGRDGLYRFTEAGGVNITDELLYPLFPHDGQPGTGANGYLPVDMSQINFMRLSAQDEQVRFIYLDTAGAQMTLRYEVTRRRFFIHQYADPMSYEYLDEPLVTSPNTLQILQLSHTLGLVYVIGGNTDNGTAITSTALAPYLDGGDERSQKLPTDWILDAGQTGTVNASQLYNNGVISGPATPCLYSGSRSQAIINVSSVADELSLYRNIGVLLTWTGGPAGPRIYAAEPAFYIQPFLSTRVITQVIGLSFPGWKMARRTYPALISTAPAVFTIYCQDGRTFTVNIPSTNGRFLIQSIMGPQCVKSLAFAFEVSSTAPFALFAEDFVVEYKEWSEGSFIKLAVFRT